MKEIKQYLRSIERQLRLPQSVRKRVMSDLSGDIEARLEAGKAPCEIFDELGTASQVAQNFNESFKKEIPTPSFWRHFFLFAAGAVFLLWLVQMAFCLYQSINLAGSVGIIGGADGPTAIYVAAQPGPFGLLPLFIGLWVCYRLFQYNGFGSRSQYRKAALFSVLGILLWLAGAAVFAADCLSLMPNSTVSIQASSYILSLLIPQMLLPSFWLPILTFILSVKNYLRCAK
ncbi:MAG: sodium ion-translocating decarboxylase subunit beta [Pygmaiobacter massiliensis]|nr:sodium ion-translocating decarboxylase subunit beta [Pygmaiobacter massiliensis]